MAATTHDTPAALPPAAPLPRPRTLFVGTAFATAAVLMYFAGLFGVYLQQPSASLAEGNAWLPKGTIPLPPGSMMMVTMVMSAVTMQWAVYAIARDDRMRSYLALGLTALFGVAVINQTVYLYTQMH